MVVCFVSSDAQLVTLKEVLLEDYSIYMVFGYTDRNFLVGLSWNHGQSSYHFFLSSQLIHHHTQSIRDHQTPSTALKSMIYQLLNGSLYTVQSHILHHNWTLAKILIPSGASSKWETAGSCV